MRDYLFRASAVGKLMTNPTAAAIKAGEVLSQGAKTYIRSLVAQEIFGIDFEVTAKVMEKGLRVEGDGIALLNRVRGLNLVKNTERRSNGLVTGECDLFNKPRRRGHDLKCSWSAATFPIVEADCIDSDYEWQMRVYMALWDADEWEVNYALVDTPDDLIGYENQAMHLVGHIPEAHRLTTWVIKRDAEKERQIAEKVRAARDYFAQVIAEFDRTHKAGAAELSPPWTGEAEPAKPAAVREAVTHDF